MSTSTLPRDEMTAYWDAGPKATAFTEKPWRTQARGTCPLPSCQVRAVPSLVTVTIFGHAPTRAS